MSWLDSTLLYYLWSLIINELFRIQSHYVLWFVTKMNEKVFKKKDTEAGTDQHLIHVITGMYSSRKLLNNKWSFIINFVNCFKNFISYHCSMSKSCWWVFHDHIQSWLPCCCPVWCIHWSSYKHQTVHSSWSSSHHMFC